MTDATLTPRNAYERALCRMAHADGWKDCSLNPQHTQAQYADRRYPEPAPRLREITFERMGWRFTVTFADNHFHLKRTLLANSATTGTEKHVWAASVAAGVMMPDDATLRALLDLPKNPTLPPQPEPTCACAHEVIGYLRKSVAYTGYVTWQGDDAKARALASRPYRGYSGPVFAMLKGPVVPAHE